MSKFTTAAIHNPIADFLLSFVPSSNFMLKNGVSLTTNIIKINYSKKKK